MPPGEWVHRARQMSLVVSERTRPRPVPVVEGPPGPGWARPQGAPALVTDAQADAVRALPGAVEDARRRADGIVAGRVRYFGYPEAVVAPDPDWHHDPVAGRDWPLVHWSQVNHRELGLDPKWIWEMGRHQGVVALARAWRLSGDDRYAECAVRHLEGFIAQNPPGRGIHWRSGLELGIRLISWAFAVELLRGSAALGAGTAGRLLTSAGAHLEHLGRYPSRYSSANNHQIGEEAGRAVGGLCFPEVPGAAGHAEEGIAALGAALTAQVLPDGVDAEQAVGYHGFVLELGLPVVACLRALGRPVPEEIAGPLAGIAGFMGVLASDGLTLPRIGDEDEGLGVDLGPAMDEADRLRFRLRAARALLEVDLPRQEPGIDEPTIWLCGLAPAERAAAAPARLPGSAAFPHGGYAVLRSRDGEGREVRAVMDAGPMGLAPMSAHGHADLLSVCMAVDGREVLIDPGTFTYFGEQRWRDYGRSTVAHSTITIDGRDQAEPAGRFMWRTQPGASLDEFTLDEGRVAAGGHHDAYAPVRHERRATLAGRTLTVTDDLTGPPGAHDVELRWHLAPGALEGSPEGWTWNGAGVSVAVAVEGLDDQRVVSGCASAPLGFSSDGLERREESPTLVARGHVSLPFRAVSRIEAPER
jgi:hypothetical protein